MRYVVLLSLILLAMTTVLKAELVEKVIVSVNGEAITLIALKDELRKMGAAEESPEARRAAVDNLIGQKLLLQEARRYGVFALDKEVEAERGKVVSSFVSREALEEELERRGMTFEDLDEEIKHQIMIYKLIKRKFESTIQPISDAEAGEYYQKNKSRFISEEKVRVEQVLITSGKKNGEQISEIVDKMLRGEEVAGEGIVVTPGAIFTPTTSLPENIARIVSKLKIGEVSDPVETETGVLIVKLIDKKPARQMTFGEVKADIKSMILREKTQRLIKQWLDERKRNSDIRVLDPRLRQIWTN